MAGLNFKVTINTKQFNKSTRLFIRLFPQAVREPLKKAAFFGLTLLKKTTPRLTGKARRGWRSKPSGKSDFLIFNRVKYIDKIETEYGPPKEPRGVTHPGGEGYKMVQRAKPQIEKRAQREFTAELLRLIGKVK